MSKHRDQDESLIGHPIMPHRDRPYRHEEIDHNNKTNLHKFLEKKRTNMNETNPIGRNHLREEEDALVREIQQRPLPPQRSDQLYL